MEMKHKMKNHMWGVHGGDEDAFIRDGYISIRETEDPISVERFVDKVRIGDTVLLPTENRMVNIGKVTGDCTEKCNDNLHVFNRKVEWLGAFPRTVFSQGAMFELGDTLKFVLIKNYMEEFKAVLREEYQEHIAEEGLDADSLDKAAFAVEDATVDYIEKKLKLAFGESELKELEEKLKMISGTAMGKAGFEDELAEVYESVMPGGIERSRLGELVMENYEELDEKYKREIPLRQVYVPAGR